MRPSRRLKRSCNRMVVHKVLELVFIPTRCLFPGLRQDGLDDVRCRSGEFFNYSILSCVIIQIYTVHFPLAFSPCSLSAEIRLSYHTALTKSFMIYLPLPSAMSVIRKSRHQHNQKARGKREERHSHKASPFRTTPFQSTLRRSRIRHPHALPNKDHLRTSLALPVSLITCSYPGGCSSSSHLPTLPWCSTYGPPGCSSAT